jgi:hypothetical protein
LRVDWRERYERAAARYAAGETREVDERQLVQLANSAWAAGLSALMAGDRWEAWRWLRQAAARYRESWDAGGAPDAWGRPIAAIKAFLIAGEAGREHGLPDTSPLLAAQWALDVGAAEAESPIGRYAAVLAFLVLGRDDEAAVLIPTLGADFPRDVADALASLVGRDAEAYAAAASRIRDSFEERESHLEDIPVPDTALALDALAARRGLV